MQLRSYQTEAVKAIVQHLRQHRSTLIVLPTGTGKTIVFASVVQKAVSAGRRALVLAHRSELIEQACDKIEAVTGLVSAVEQADQRVDPAHIPDIVCASVQTLSQPTRLEAYRPDTFALVVVDEAHHAPAETYQRILDHFTSAKVLGVTATPDRLDQVGLGRVFDSISFEYDIRNAVEDGWLVPIRQKRVFVDDLDLRSVRTVCGDFNQGDLERELVRDQVLHEVASPLSELAGKRPTLVFTVGVEQAHKLAEVLTGYVGDGKVMALDGTASTDHRAQVIADFHAGRIQYLVNCALFTEGFDAPPTSCVAVARPTKSRALYTQMIGRGTRLDPNSGKKDCLVLDFVGNAGKHRLVSSYDVLDGRPIEDDVRAKAEQIADQNSDLLVQQVLDLAVAQVEAEKRRRVTAQARYETRSINPFVLLEADSRPGRWGGVGPTEKQLHFLQRNGFEFRPGEIDKGQASALIDKIIQRSEQGLCTPKQAKFLMRYGLNSHVSFEDASEAIDLIAGNGWKPPRELFRDKRFQRQVSV